MDFKDIQKMLDANRDQKFRKRTDSQIEGINKMQATRAELFKNDPEWRARVQAQAAKMKAMRNSEKWRQSLKDNHFIKQTKDPKLKKRMTEKGLQTKLKNGNIRDQTLYKELYYKCWGPDRSAELYQKLADEYNIPFNTIKGVANGSTCKRGGNAAFITKEQHLQNLEDWKWKYCVYKVVDPDGNEYKFVKLKDVREKLNMPGPEIKFKKYNGRCPTCGPWKDWYFYAPKVTKMGGY